MEALLILNLIVLLIISWQLSRLRGSLIEHNHRQADNIDVVLKAMQERELQQWKRDEAELVMLEQIRNRIDWREWREDLDMLLEEHRNKPRQGQE